MKKLIDQIIKFGIIGVIAFIIDYSLLFILTEFLHIHYLISAVISFTVSVIFNYVASIKWVFITEKKQDTSTFIIFVVLSVIGLGINQVIMYVGVEFIKLHYMFTKIFATAIVMVYNFITRKIFIEGKQ